MIKDVPPVLSDRNAVTQVLNQLLDNAIKFNAESRVVELIARQRGKYVWIAVRDHGIGIASEHLPRLFERFYRADPSRSRKLGGTGLGLAIVKHIVNAHGGRITVESTPGKGSEFIIYIPHQVLLKS
jgi:two-component system phosphate regulon sensor histidine kinase PhoR